jgi:hypothetical protein
MKNMETIGDIEKSNLSTEIRWKSNKTQFKRMRGEKQYS